MRSIIVEDHPELSAMMRDYAPTFLNAEEATHYIEDHKGEVDKVFCDFNGIEKNGHNAKTILELCRKEGIHYVQTTSDIWASRDFQDQGIETIAKSDVLKLLSEG